MQERKTKRGRKLRPAGADPIRWRLDALEARVAELEAGARKATPKKAAPKKAAKKAAKKGGAK